MNTHFIPPKPITVTLDWNELRFAALVGIERYIDNLKLGTQHTNGTPMSAPGWEMNIFGACGEMAVAKHLGLYWNGALGNWKADDVGEYQVRTSKRDNADLRLHPTDRGDRKFILLTGLTHVFKIVGWLKAEDGKREEYWRAGGKDTPHAFWVPQNVLNPMSSLRSE
jgi:hypothetical protein